MKKYFLVAALILAACSNTNNARYPKIEKDTAFLEDIVKTLSVDIGPRNYSHANRLAAASRYIQLQFQQLGFDVQTQTYKVGKKTVENVIVSLGPEQAERIIVGAHYDSFGEQPGADDNASGVAGLLGLAKLLKSHESELKKRIDLVAFTLEEPPYFRTEHMGSYVHAKSLKDANVDVAGMISLEMIGYFSDEEDSQRYPLSLLHLFYPDKAEFIGVVSNMSSGGLKSTIRDHMAHSDIKVRSLSAPASLVGVDFSDHLNYWNLGYDAVMVTDTAFYRNDNYHESTDTIETLNFDKMSSVVEGVYFAVLNIAIN